MAEVITYHRFHVMKRYWFLKHHLVKRPNKKGFKESDEYLMLEKYQILQSQNIHNINLHYSSKQILTIQKLAMVNSHSSYTTYKFEVREMIFIAQARIWIDLQRIVIPGEEGEKTHNRCAILYSMNHYHIS